MKRLLITTIILLNSIYTQAAGPFEWRRKGPGCLSKDSMVLLATGETIRIDKINKSVKTMSVTDTITKTLHITKGFEKILLKITLESGKVVKATTGHPFIDGKNHFILAKNIKSGSYLKTIDGNEEVTQVKEINYNDYVYNLYLSNNDVLAENFKDYGSTWRKVAINKDPFLNLKSMDHTFYVNGIASGDLLIQKAMLE